MRLAQIDNQPSAVRLSQTPHGATALGNILSLCSLTHRHSIIYMYLVLFDMTANLHCVCTSSVAVHPQENSYGMTVSFSPWLPIPMYVLPLLESLIQMHHTL